MHSQTSLKALRAIAFSLVSLSACAVSMAGDIVLAKADTTAQFVRATAPAAAAVAQPMVATFPSLADAELIGMGFESSFDTILAEALGTPTAAGYAPMPSRGEVEAVVSRVMGGMMP